ncbi:MAG TPA: 50S ribosomal protein L4 [Candidatus Marinimicrobia bacterium]|nr:50S ribosomal protein L4 [Candidatus Neomarinimicrobiota bacterium]|tara:strand:+ start:5543 stop:6163 length:621 start_codon:yes stop_codon:yes gene_type:complete
MKIKSINSSKDYSLNDSVFKVPMNDQAVYQCVIAELTNARQGTRSTKNRSLVSGGGRKPFKQKGTGNARQGTSRSPLNRGGGVIFGPSPAYYFKKINAKTKKLAFKCVLSEKVKNDALKVIDSIELETNKTKDFVSFLGSNSLSGNKMTIVVSEVDQNLELASRNVESVNVVKASSCSVADLLNNDTLLLDANALTLISERFGDKK